MNLLIFLTHPEPTRSGYEKYLAPRHPELTIKTVATRDEALEHAAWADILMAFGPQAKTDFFRDTPRLKWVHALGTGTDGITDSPFLGKDVIVTAVRGIHGEPISELAFLQIAQDRVTEQQTLDAMIRVLLVGGALVVLVALAFGAVYAERALVPIRDSLASQRGALRRQREFAADASHELRTPLTVVRSSVEHLRRQPEVPLREQTEALDDIDAEVTHLTGLVDDLLLLARSDSGALSLTPMPTDLGDVVAEADHRFQAVHRAGRDQPILLQVAPHHPADDEEHRGRDQPQHQDVLGHREVDAENARQMDQRLADRAVGDVMDDHLAGVEFLGDSVCGLGGRGAMFLNFLDQHRVIRPQTGGASKGPRSDTRR